MEYEYTAPDIWGFKIGYEYYSDNDKVMTIYADNADFKIEIVSVLERPDQIEFKSTSGDLEYTGDGKDAALHKTLIQTPLGHVVSLHKLFTDIIRAVVDKREIDLEEMAEAEANEAEYARATCSPYLTGRI